MRPDRYRRREAVGRAPAGPANRHDLHEEWNRRSGRGTGVSSNNLVQFGLQVERVSAEREHEEPRECGRARRRKPGGSLGIAYTLSRVVETDDRGDQCPAQENEDQYGSGHGDRSTTVELSQFFVDLVVPNQAVDPQGDEWQTEPNREGIACLHGETRRHRHPRRCWVLPCLQRHPRLRVRRYGLRCPRIGRAGNRVRRTLGHDSGSPCMIGRLDVADEPPHRSCIKDRGTRHGMTLAVRPLPCCIVTTAPRHHASNSARIRASSVARDVIPTP
ncbi:MAG: hypothetical protein JWM93_572 [Frankiales bacterium]|nr:hypothetical protein [Frankiales bacterium]